MTSGLDGAPSYSARCEHLPDRTIAVHLVEDGTLLGTLDGVRQSFPLVKRWAADHLGIPPESFRLTFHVPRPPYVHDGGLVTFQRDDVHVTGQVATWADSAVLVTALEPHQSYSGLVPPEDLTFLD